MSTGNTATKHTFITRASIARDVYDAVYLTTESFEPDHIGEDLAYLMGAILKNTYVSFASGRAILRILRSSVVWTAARHFVKVEEE